MMSKEADSNYVQTPLVVETKNVQQPHSPSWSSWDELMGGDLKMKVISRPNDEIFIEREDDIIDPNFVGNVDVTQAEMNDYVVISYDGYFITKETSDNDLSQMEEIFTKNDPSHHGYIRFVNVDNVCITLGNGDIPQGLELAIRFLSKGQSAIVCSHYKYAHPHGRKNTCIAHDSVAINNVKEKGDEILSCYDLPPSTNVAYRVYLKSIKSSSEYQSDEFRFKVAHQLKVVGNDYFTNEWMGPNGGFGKSKALKAYNNATKELISLLNDFEQREKVDNKVDDDDDGKIKDQVEALLVDCFNNISAVFLRDKEYVKAKEAATQAIQIDPNNLKALKRAAKASMMSCSFEESYASLEVASEVKHDDAEVLKLRTEYERRLKAYQKKEKAMYARMMISKKNHGNGSSSEAGLTLNNPNRNNASSTSRSENEKSPINSSSTIETSFHPCDDVQSGSKE